jgi:hypothetical protein
MGMRGRSLDLMVSVIATTGFLLFGYDRKLLMLALIYDMLNFARGRYVWNYIRRAFHGLLPRDVRQSDVERLRYRDL